MPLLTYLSSFFNQSTTESTNHPPLERASGDIHRGNLVWFEDDFAVGSVKILPFIYYKIRAQRLTIYKFFRNGFIANKSQFVSTLRSTVATTAVRNDAHHIDHYFHFDHFPEMARAGSWDCCWMFNVYFDLFAIVNVEGAEISLRVKE